MKLNEYGQKTLAHVSLTRLKSLFHSPISAEISVVIVLLLNPLRDLNPLSFLPIKLEKSHLKALQRGVMKPFLLWVKNQNCVIRLLKNGLPKMVMNPQFTIYTQWRN